MKFDLEPEDLRPIVAEVVEVVFARRERLEARLPDQLTFSEADGGQWLGWITAGLPTVMAGTHERAGEFVARIMFLAARRRWREAETLMKGAPDAS